MDNEIPILPAGLMFSKACARCGGRVECQYDFARSKKKNWKAYCSMRCFRAAQTKYVGLTARQRRQAYDRARTLKLRAKRMEALSHG